MQISHHNRKAPARLVLSVTAFLAVATPGIAARADVTTTYPATGCHALNFDMEQQVQRFPGTVILNQGDNGEDAQIVCPIAKRTSGPGITNDRIANVTISAGLGTLTCSIIVYQVDPAQSGGTSNVVESLGEFNNGGYQFTLSLSSNATNYWQNSSKWRYAELHCRSNSGVRVYDYSVLERGSSQSGRRIVSSAACTPPAAQAYGFNAGPFAVPFGGFVAASGMETQFSMRCPPQSGAGRFVQIGLGPTVGSSVNLMGCRNETSNTWQYVQPRTGLSTEFPPRTLTFSPSVPTALICEMKNHPNIGDAKVFSYRTTSTTF